MKYKVIKSFNINYNTFLFGDIINVTRIENGKYFFNYICNRHKYKKETCALYFEIKKAEVKSKHPEWF